MEFDSPMQPAPSPRPLKICGTCRYWTKEYKGFCLRLRHGVGKFHLCAGWENPVSQPGAEAPPAAADSSCLSQAQAETP